MTCVSCTAVEITSTSLRDTSLAVLGLTFHLAACIHRPRRDNLHLMLLHRTHIRGLGYCLCTTVVLSCTGTSGDAGNASVGAPDASVFAPDAGDTNASMASDTSSRSDAAALADAADDASEAGAVARSPQSIPGLQLWLSSDQLVTCANQRVQQWGDRSGQNRNAVAAGGGGGPACGNGATLNGKPVLFIPTRLANNLDDYTLNVDMTFLTQQSFSIFAVIRKNSDYGDFLSSHTSTANCVERRYFALGFGKDTLQSGPFATFHMCDGLSARTLLATAPATTQAFAVGAWLDTSSGRAIYINGTRTDFNPSTDAKKPLLSVTGGRIGRGAAQTAFSGDVAEIVAWPRALDPAEVAGLQTYFRQTWGL